jgi:hypothetical protein
MLVGNGCTGVIVNMLVAVKNEAVLANDAVVQLTAYDADVDVLAFPLNEPYIIPDVTVIDPFTDNDPLKLIDSTADPNNTLYISET